MNIVLAFVLLAGSGCGWLKHGASNANTFYGRTTALGIDKLYVVIDQTTRRSRDVYLQGGTREDLGTTSDRLGVVEIDLVTARCTWRDDQPRFARGEPGFRRVAAGELERHGIQSADGELVHRSGRRVAVDTSTPVVAGNLLAVVDPMLGGYRVIDPASFETRHEIVFPLGELEAIAPGTAIFGAPAGDAWIAVTFEGSSAAAPVVGPRPRRAREYGWAATIPLGLDVAPVAIGNGRTLRVVGSPEDPQLEVEAWGDVRRFPISLPAVHFEGTHLVAGATTLIDVHYATTLEAEVRRILAFEDGRRYYLWLANGRVWHADLHITEARPLAVRLGDLVAIRGTRWVFQNDPGDTIYIHDLRDATWRWQSYRACMPERARDHG